MKLRTGRRNGKNLYVQWGDVPTDDDFSIGYVENPDIARWIVREMNEIPLSSDSLQAIVVRGMTHGT